MNKVLCLIASALFMLAAVGCQKANNCQSAAVAADSTSLTIAYINTDSLLSGYKYAQKLSSQLMSKDESARADFNQKYRVFQQDAVEFKRKVENNGFLSMERAQAEQQRLQKAEQDLQELNQRLSNELAQEQARMSMELNDTLMNFLNTFGKGRYKLILQTSMMNRTVLYSEPSADITAEVIDALNARYNEK